MVRREIKLLCAAVLAAAALTACTQADQNNSTVGDDGGTTGSGNMTAETTAAQSEAVSETAASQGGEETPAQSEEISGGENAQTAGAQGTEAATEAAAAVLETAEEVTEEETEQETETAAAEENYSDEEWDELNETENADWNGTFTSAEGETLSISVVDADTISFAFTNAGVSGEAEVSGAQAVYHGDDYHVVVFDFVADSVEVSVLSEEDYDTSGSPMNGTYTRD